VTIGPSFVASAVGSPGAYASAAVFASASPRHEHAGLGVAGLAAVHVAGAHGVRHGLGERLVGQVVQQDRGTLAAQLEGHPLHGARSQLEDALAHRVRPGETHHVDVRVYGQRLADGGPVAVDQVEHPGGHPHRVDGLGEGVRGERGDLAGLDHHRAARREGGADLRGDLVQRVVPRGDGPDDTDRLAHDHRVP
jgi:hypothetical protein